MDEMHINTKFMRRIIASIIERTIRNRLGVDPSIMFNGPIDISYGDDGVNLHLDVNVKCKKDQFEKLLSNI